MSVGSTEPIGTAPGEVGEPATGAPAPVHDLVARSVPGTIGGPLWETDPGQAARRLVLKRIFDLVAGTLLALVATPVIILLAVVSLLALREWPLFTQERIGQHGRTFTFVKIRTMPSTTNRYALKHDLDTGQLPRPMRLLRRLHLDELPQLWLVPLGRMSLVGPRPRMPDEFEPVDRGYHEARVSVPQGCTCLWQIGLDKAGLPSEAPEYDYWYLQHGGLRLDLWILFWTALTLVGIAEPKSLSDVPTWLRSRGWGSLLIQERPAVVIQPTELRSAA